ncbi:antA/AntB antirepressor family protein [Roseomonas sp. BN140053]|uniref:antA/AntB antirepressor family protein n=1 Tax=Roseomonas sp. BN140053 TaxID=3391898 RepID=UPI0039E80F5E
MEQVIGGARVQTVDARDLHSALGVRKRFTDWAKQQINRLRLHPDRDYRGEVSPLEGINSGRGRPEATYWFTLDAAKHVAMMANTEKGFEVREYFIECERRVHGEAIIPPAQAVVDPLPSAIAQDPAWAAWLSLPKDERTCRQQDVKLYRQMGGPALMRWAAWNCGLPIPPHYLLGVREQFEMELQRRAGGQGSSILISVNQGGGNA